MPDTTQITPKKEGEGVEGSKELNTNAEAEELKVQKEKEAFQAEQAKKDAEQAKQAEQNVKEAEDALKTDQEARRKELLKVSGTAPTEQSEIEKSEVRSNEPMSQQTPAVEGQAPIQPDAGSQPMPEQTQEPQQMSQEPAIQPVKPDVAEETKEPEVPKKGFWAQLFGFGKEPEKPNDKNEENVKKTEGGDPEAAAVLEQTAIGHQNEVKKSDQNAEVGENPENK